jgi:hypothetical protein
VIVSHSTFQVTCNPPGGAKLRAIQGRRRESRRQSDNGRPNESSKHHDPCAVDQTGVSHIVGGECNACTKEFIPARRGLWVKRIPNIWHFTWLRLASVDPVQHASSARMKVDAVARGSRMAQIASSRTKIQDTCIPSYNDKDPGCCDTRFAPPRRACRGSGGHYLVAVQSR